MNKRISNTINSRWFNWLLSGIFLIAVFSAMLLLNSKTLYVADDYVYRFFYQSTYAPDAGPVISTLSIPHSMYNHYMLWNGRFVAHSIVQFFMQFDTKVVFNICNSLAFIALMFLIAKTSSTLTKVKTNWWLLVAIFVYLWFAIPSFGQTVLWVSGSGNYLWTSLIYLGTILIALKHQKETIWLGIVAVILGFLTGATNENSGPAAIVIIFLFAVVKYIQSKKIDWYSLITSIFGLIGFLVMYFSPGSQARGDKPHSYYQAMIGLKQLVVHQYKWFYLIILILLVAGLLMKKLNKDLLLSAVVFLVGHILSIVVLVMSPEYPLRTLFGATVFLAITFFILVYSLLGNLNFFAEAAISLVILVMFMVSYRTAYIDINTTYIQAERQYQVIEKAKDEHKKSVTVPMVLTPKSDYNAFKGTLLLDTNSGAWMNMWVAKFFGIDQISGKF
ncbi:DUF3329 domain-containing protein [Companilactobacillus zhongbaensis]|uniref:DUF3329 domain-containing protein n=1 Tax=Companilactobacillus zhongbaensis TaxID=2486009 RepID=UPI000F784F3A|nr:DUF6056 family protein [Companilactobacillus zhongbaensis]